MPSREDHDHALLPDLTDELVDKAVADIHMLLFRERVPTPPEFAAIIQNQHDVLMSLLNMLEGDVALMRLYYEQWQACYNAIPASYSAVKRKLAAQMDKLPVPPEIPDDMRAMIDEAPRHRRLV